MPGQNQGQLPLLMLPQPSAVERQGGQRMPPTLHVPSHSRQGERLTPKFATLQTAFDAQRLELATVVNNSDPNLVIVFETIGAVNDFIPTAERITGLEWLLAAIGAQFEPDDDFYTATDPEKLLSGKLFLLGSNRQALEEIVSLWSIYKDNSEASLGPGLSAWKSLFTNLKEVRFWGPEDRLNSDLRDAWTFQVEHGAPSLRFEIEAWSYESAEKNAAASGEIQSLVQQLGGAVLDEHLIVDISYHGFLVEIPASGVRSLLAGSPPPLLKSDRVMALRGRGQASAQPATNDERALSPAMPAQVVSGLPIVAMLDGLPIANHPRLQGRVIVDDPDQWGQAYPAANRIHGTAIASLIAWGGLETNDPPLRTPIYARPILRWDSTGEATPNDKLLIDLVHVAVRRMFENGPWGEPVAPSVKVINLSVGDAQRPFSGELSPWARLLDWLSFKYRVLFIVSSGNHLPGLAIPTDVGAFRVQNAAEHGSSSMRALMASDLDRSILSPSESVNALTVGACFSDGSTYAELHGSYSLFPQNGIAPYSRIGPGFRRAIKPDILLPGGRVRFRERPISPDGETHLTGTWNSSQAPGQLVAAPITPAGDSVYSRGTSNAAALASRWAGRAHEVLEVLRAGDNRLHSKYDAVLLKALLAHGANLGEIEACISQARPDVAAGQARRRLISRYAGYGVADVEKALTCTEQRVTLLGVGEVKNDKAWSFRIPLPPSLNATLVRRRLTITLAWLTPTNPRHSKYRGAKLWADIPENPLSLNRLEGEHRQIQMGTLHHETFEGERAVPIVDGQTMVIRVNCVADAGRLVSAAEFALCVSLEVAEGLNVPIYQEVRQAISTRVDIHPRA